MPRGRPRHRKVRQWDDEARRTRRSRATAWEVDDLDFESIVISKRKWDDLEFDCLVNIFGRVGLKSLLLDVPFVCRSWCKASLDFSCCQRIDRIPRLHSFGSKHSRFIQRFIGEFRIKIDKFSVVGFMRLLVARGLGKSGCTALSRIFSDDDLQIVAEKCPELKAVCLNFHRSGSSISNKVKLLEKWKELEEIRIEWPPAEITVFKELLAQIALNCKNVRSLIVSRGGFCEEYALAIGEHLPRIKSLIIKLCYLEQENLEIVLHHCKELEYLDVSSSGYHINDWEKEKLQQLASHVKNANLDAFHCYGTYYTSDFGSGSDSNASDSE